MNSFFKDKVLQLLESVDIKVNGSRPWDIQVHNERIYKRVILGGSLGFGEAYLDGWFDAENMDEMFIRLMVGGGSGGGGVRSKMFVEKAGRKFQAVNNALTNRQAVERAGEVATTHYDVGNDLFEQMLDPLMMYSCG